METAQDTETRGDGDAKGALTSRHVSDARCAHLGVRSSLFRFTRERQHARPDDSPGQASVTARSFLLFFSEKKPGVSLCDGDRSFLFWEAALLLGERRRELMFAEHAPCGKIRLLNPSEKDNPDNDAQSLCPTRPSKLGHLEGLLYSGVGVDVLGWSWKYTRREPGA